MVHVEDLLRLPSPRQLSVGLQLVSDRLLGRLPHAPWRITLGDQLALILIGKHPVH